ncbi:MAG: acetyl-CoA carboxylase carboxyltransferase subunit beta [Saprospiraceae bacterium]|nr:acetyl-CoA carboxylase carboxyltransferase subunit beta [Saprospiraceae bacterium]MBK8449661.1 acetyl-CoA carboxylase carboxyltransferase subunit beta [Saprospiraceae bacterium]MBK8484282.1 acetyl-CoA carboxylase carboxyltransferase subunit beta [Saprospiraceae bacterium]MBK9221667.1 acetyl-CoA carboxylase carboxyltransferase subunit beta [Saprospiraceae bacterium]MBK9721397.1 acetyl-CoA carboxylase carboxyltransferase subunit beta [Saprospiraceae bacterium]
MGWFKRLKEGISTKTKGKKETPDGIWFKCPECSEMLTTKQLKESIYKCPKCNYHTRISSDKYFDLIYDDDYVLLFENLISTDFLHFKDLQSYQKRLDDARANSEHKDSITVAIGTIGNRELVTAAMDFTFIGGSMGSVMGEKISRAIDVCIERKAPLLIISKSGGARMMESAFSLMQMAKTSAKLTQLAKHKIPYFSFLTDPTTGGVTASFAMLGDINFSEPNALIGFAGPRVVKETIKRDLPEGFQRSEFLLENGFLDFIIDRKDLKATLSDLIEMLQPIEV